MAKLLTINEKVNEILRLVEEGKYFNEALEIVKDMDKQLKEDA